MEKWEEYILTKWLPINLKKGLNETDRYVELGAVLALNYDEQKLRKLVSLLDSYGIKVCDDKITKEERNPLVRDLNYGEIIASSVVKDDVPVYSELDYAPNNEIIYEDYSALDQKIEKEFLPKKLKIKRYNLDDGSTDIIAYVQLHEITKLKLSEAEFKHVFQFLEQRDILVHGINSTIDMDNYKYISTYKNEKLPETVSWSIQLKWFEEYEQLKENNAPDEEIRNVRNKIVEANYRLVPYVNYKLSIRYGFDINELNSIGSIGLINAVECFDYKQGFKFSTYAYKAILNRVLRDYSKEMGFYLFKQYTDVKKAIEAISEFYDEMGIPKDVSEKEVIELLRQTGSYTLDTAKVITNTYFDNEVNGFSLDDESNEEEIEKLSVTDEEVFGQELGIVGAKDVLHDVLKTLTPREYITIVKRFGLEDGVQRSLDEVALIFGVSGERIRQIEAKALRKLRHPSRAKHLKGFIDLDYISSKRI